MNKKPLRKKIQKYKSNGQITQEYLGGHTIKGFMRLDDNTDEINERQDKSDYHVEKTDKDSYFFGELFRDLMSGNSHYMTYLNPSIVGKDPKDISLPRHVSCLVKDYGPKNTGCVGENLGSRLANALGIDTVYNLAYEEKYYTKENEKGSNFYLISVDYVPWGYTTEAFHELGISFSTNESLDKILNRIDCNIKIIAKKNKIDLTLDKLIKIKKDFAKQYLFRQFIIDDYDFEDKNACMLFSKDGEIRLGPCFDMEMAFENLRPLERKLSLMLDTISYMQEVMPDVLKEFVTSCQTALDNGTIDKVMSLPIKVNVRTLHNIKEKVKENISMLAEFTPSMSSMEQ